MNSTQATLILPCYNEAQHIKGSVARILKILEASPFSWEVIFIDDKSRDQTAGYIKSILKKPTPVKLRAIFHKKNQGRGATVAEGINMAKAEIVGYIDIDCEIDPHYIPLFVDKIKQGYDLVYAWRIYQFGFSHLIRHLASRAYLTLQQKLLAVDFPDTEAGYKFFRKKTLMPLLPTIIASHWFWDTEVLVKGKLARLKISYIPTVFLRRGDKKSTVNLFSDTIDYIGNLWRLRQEIKL